MKFSGPGFDAWMLGDRELPTGVDGQDPDVHVRLENGELYVATFYTLDRLRVRMEECRVDGGYSNGSYFVDESMVIVRDLDEATIVATVRDLVASGKLASVFTQCRCSEIPPLPAFPPVPPP